MKPTPLKRLMRWHCAHGTKASRWRRASRLLEGAENLVQWKVMGATWPKQYEEGPLTARALTRSLRITDQRETQLCIFPRFKVINIAMQHFKEWWWIWIHGKHCTSRLLKLEEKTTKQNNPKPKPQQAPWGPGCLWKCSQAWPLKSTVRSSAQTQTRDSWKQGTVGFRCSKHNGRKPKAGKNKLMVHSRCATRTQDLGHGPLQGPAVPSPFFPPRYSVMAKSAL